MKSIEFKNVTFGYKRNEAILSDVSFRIAKPLNRGSVIALMGNSGSGKSTVLKLILGIEKQNEGEILIYPQNPVISYVPQEPVLFEHLSLLENAAYFKRVKHCKAHFNQEQFDKLADILQLKDILYSVKSINEISGGQKQRISLLRALSIQPDILLLDEPLTGLDEEVKDVFLQMMAELVDSLGLLVIYITHHKKEVEFISDEVVYLVKEDNRSIVQEVSLSKTESFFKNPPTLSALNAIKKISTNVIRIKETDNGILLPVANGLSDVAEWRYMVFEQNVICFGNDYGYRYKIIHTAGLYSFVKLEKEGIVITVSKEKVAGSKFIFLEGNVKIYGSKGSFAADAEIRNGKLLY